MQSTEVLTYIAKKLISCGATNFVPKDVSLIAYGTHLFHDQMFIEYVSKDYIFLAFDLSEDFRLNLTDLETLSKLIYESRN